MSDVRPWAAVRRAAPVARRAVRADSTYGELQSGRLLSAREEALTANCNQGASSALVRRPSRQIAIRAPPQRS